MKFHKQRGRPKKEGELLTRLSITIEPSLIQAIKKDDEFIASLSNTIGRMLRKYLKIKAAERVG